MNESLREKLSSSMVAGHVAMAPDLALRLFIIAGLQDHITRTF